MAVIKHCRNHRAVTRSLALDLANGLLVLTHKNSVASSKPKVYELSSMHRVDPGRTTDVFRASWRRRVNDDRCLSLHGVAKHADDTGKTAITPLRGKYKGT